MITFIAFVIGFWCGGCYTINLDDLLDGNWMTWLLSPVLVPWHIYRAVRGMDS